MKLIKEIRSKEGELHFQRYLLWETKWFNVYIHKIYRADEDEHLHSHPWYFAGIILEGGYIEEREDGEKKRSKFSLLYGDLAYFHKIKKILAPTKTLFIAGKKKYAWGYKVKGLFVRYNIYREMKHRGKL